MAGRRNADLGRIERQQLFIRTAVNELLAEIETTRSARRPDRAGASALQVDENADPVRPAEAMREAAAGGLVTFTLPVEREHGGQSALDLIEYEAEPMLDYFRGVVGPPPPQTRRGTDNGD